MTVPSSAVPVDGDGDGDVGVDVVGGGVGCGMWYVVGGNSRQGKSLESVTDEGVLCLVGLCFLPRSSLHHTHTHTCAPTTLSRAVAAATLLESATVAPSVSLDESSIIEPSIDQPL